MAERSNDSRSTPAPAAGLHAPAAAPARPAAKAPTTPARKPAARRALAAAGRASPARRGEPSVIDIARQASVSIGTVSRVINQHPSVDPELRRRVVVASRKLGFVPRVANRCIALLTGRASPALPVGYVSVVTSLVNRFLGASRYSVELIDIENLDLVYRTHIEGVIGVVFDDRVAQLRDIPNLPLLTINNPMTQLGIHSVRTDHRQQALLATRHLVEHGHRRVALLQIESGEWGSDQRLAGYHDALREAGIVADPTLVQYTREQPLYDVLHRWIGRGVTGILNFSEDAALEALHILSNILKLRIGRDVSTVTLEDLPVFQYLSPPQTTIRQPLEQLAQLAVEKMLGLCAAAQAGKGPHEVLDICLPAELVQRESVATLTHDASTTPQPSARD